MLENQFIPYNNCKITSVSTGLILFVWDAFKLTWNGCLRLGRENDDNFKDVNFFQPSVKPTFPVKLEN